MIKNDSQLAITEMWIGRFKQTLALAPPHLENVHPRIIEAQRNGLRAKLKELEDEVKEYKERKGIK